MAMKRTHTSNQKPQQMESYKRSNKYNKHTAEENGLKKLIKVEELSILS